MPIPILGDIFYNGLSVVPYGWTILKAVPWLALIYLIKRYTGGAVNQSERVMHGKVIMMTGGTSGIGASTAQQLALRGAQIIFLTQHPLSDPFLVEYILDLRRKTNNDLITAEQCDHSSLHSIRLFATKWIDNAPPRRLDMIVLCANTKLPWGAVPQTTMDGLESTVAIDYLSVFHLLSILSPSIRAQPPDRQVRIVFGLCSTQLYGVPHIAADTAVEQLLGGINGDKPIFKATKKSKTSTQAHPTESAPRSPSSFAQTQMALTTFASAFNKHLQSFSRPDKLPPNLRVLLVDPGFARTPGMRRHLTFGSLWGLLLYLIMWPIWWLALKSPEQGAQSFLTAAMEADIGDGSEIALLKEGRSMPIVRKEIWADEEVQKALWKGSEAIIEKAEKEGAIKRAADKKAKGGDEKKPKAPEGSGTATAPTESRIVELDGDESQTPKAATPRQRRKA